MVHSMVWGLNIQSEVAKLCSFKTAQKLKPFFEVSTKTTQDPKKHRLRGTVHRLSLALALEELRF